MIATATKTPTNLWTDLATPLDREDIQWRLDSKPTAQGGKWFARVVAYADVPAVRARLDAVCPGEWDFTASDLPTAPGREVAMKGRLQILGVIREDVGQGPDYKQALTDAFKRTARLFGIGIELWTMGPVYVEVSDSGDYAKIVGDPWAKVGRPALVPASKSVPTVPAGGLERAKQVLDLAPVADDYGHPINPTTNGQQGSHAAVPAGVEHVTADNPSCPKCTGQMWDNRVGKRNPKAPDFKCRDRSCDGVIWPPKGGKAQPATVPADDPDAPPF